MRHDSSKRYLYYESITVTVWRAMAMLPDTSIAYHITIVIPSGNTFGALFDIIGSAPRLPVTDAMPIFTGVMEPVCFTVTFGGGVRIRGGACQAGFLLFKYIDIIGKIPASNLRERPRRAVDGLTPCHKPETIVSRA